MDTPVKNALTVLMENAKVHLESNGTLLPMVAINDKGEPCLSTLQRGDESDDAFFQRLKGKIARGEVRETCVFAEADFVSDFPDVNDRPNSVLLVAYSSAAEEFFYTAPITRHDKLVECGPWLRHESKTDLSYPERFGDLWKKAMAGNN